MNPIIHCSKCGSDKPREAFHPSRIRGNFKSTWCKDCLRSYHAAYFATEKGKAVKRDSLARARLRNPHLSRAANLRFLYGISLADYDRMSQEQDGRCYLCQRSPTTRRRLAVDHDHATGRVRRLLCQPCNSSLGTFKDDPEALRRAAAYIESFRLAPTE